MKRMTWSPILGFLWVSANNPRGFKCRMEVRIPSKKAGVPDYPVAVYTDQPSRLTEYLKRAGTKHLEMVMGR